MQAIAFSILSDRYGLPRSSVLWWNCHGKEEIENLSFEQRASRYDHHETEFPWSAIPNRIWERGEAKSIRAEVVPFVNVRLVN